jgi:hypothetical protein
MGGRLSLPHVATLVNTASLVLLASSIAYIPLYINRTLLGKLSAFASSLITASAGYTAYWMMSGMETVFVMALLAIYLSFAITRTKLLLLGDFKSWKTVGIIGMVLSISRLEAAMVVSVSIGVIYCFYLTKKWGQLRENIKIAVCCSLPGFGVVALLVFYRLYYGRFLPDPLVFKELARYYRRTPKQSLEISIDFLTQSMSGLFRVAILVLLVVLIVNIKKRTINFPLIFATLVFVLWLLALANSPHSDEMRYQLPLLVVIGAIISAALAVLLANTWSRKSLICGLLIFGLFIGNAALGNYRQFAKIRTSTAWSWEIQQARIDMGKKIAEYVPKNSRIWSGDLGALSFFDHDNIYIDGAALVNHQLLEVVENSGDYSREIIRQRPEYIVDSVGENDGRPSVLSIFDAPQNYYDSSQTDTKSACSSAESLSLEELSRAETPTAPIDVRLYKITWKSCK